ncbi:MAG TPA: tetratricopeptide repeat protein [Ignavibacteriaceae bacterium]|nr:tetratricopeptide repeat protein [Ignavibacteriaceae bacterium]
MSLVCNQCNFKLQEDFAFCPKCGAELTIEPSDREIVITKVFSEVQEFALCSDCGAENKVSVSFCEWCGIKLDNPKIVQHTIEKKSNVKPADEIKSEKPKIPVVDNVKKKSSQKKKDSSIKIQKSSSNSNYKSIDDKKLFGVIAIVIVLGIVILYSAGVFDSHKVESKVNSQPPQGEQSQSVDLNNLQKINQLRDIVNNNPENYSAMLDLAHLLMDSRIFGEAIDNYKKYLEKNPNVPDVLVDMGVCYFELKQYDDAIKYMEQAIKTNPMHQIGHLNLGVVNLSKGNVEVANKWFQKAIEINPGTEIAQRARHLLESH